MPKIPGPTEFYRGISIGDGYRRERLYKGRGGKKKVMDFITHEKRNGAMYCKIESCIPQWLTEYEYKSEEWEEIPRLVN